MRANKLHRAKQLGFPYPRENETQMLQRESIHLLFVCSMNRWRSPTAEKIYAKRSLIQARSCGTSRKAARTVQAADLTWADLICVMETKHKEQLQSRFPGELRYRKIHVLDIPDDYQLMSYLRKNRKTAARQSGHSHHR